MADLKGHMYEDEYGWKYEIVSKYSNGYAILYHKDSVCQWVILCPDNSMKRFETEAALWHYALENKLFKRKGQKKQWESP